MDNPSAPIPRAPSIPTRSIVRSGDRFGIVLGTAGVGVYEIAIVVDGKHVGNENWKKEEFDVIRQGRN
jgi:hypothetical protein